VTSLLHVSIALKDD